jgi:hypothetical protein
MGYRTSNKMKITDYHILKLTEVKTSMKYYNSTNKVKFKYYHDCVRKYVTFKWDFFTHVTGITETEWRKKYPIDTIECGFDYLHEHYGILSDLFGSSCYLLIPKDKPEIFEIFKETYTLKYDILKRLNYSVYLLQNYKIDWRRERSESYAKEFEKYFKD